MKKEKKAHVENLERKYKDWLWWNNLQVRDASGVRPMHKKLQQSFWCTILEFKYGCAHIFQLIERLLCLGFMTAAQSLHWQGSNRLL